MNRVCGVCAYENPLGANFCMSCGAPLGRPVGEEHTAAMDSIRPEGSTGDHAVVGADGIDDAPRGWLEVRHGPKRGSRIALGDDQITIGRHPESDIFLDDITVSRRHAEIDWAGGGYQVRDVGSLNGTYVNKTLVERGVLHDGDELQIGKFKLVVVIEGEHA